jgi:hypothetical protein
MLQYVDTPFSHSVVGSQRACCKKGRQLFVDTEGKGFPFCDTRLGAETDPGGGLVTLPVLHQVETVPGSLRRQLQFLFLADEGQNPLVRAVSTRRVCDKERGMLVS